MTCKPVFSPETCTVNLLSSKLYWQKLNCFHKKLFSRKVLKVYRLYRVTGVQQVLLGPHCSTGSTGPQVFNRFYWAAGVEQILLGHKCSTGSTGPQVFYRFYWAAGVLQVLLGCRCSTDSTVPSSLRTLHSLLNPCVSSLLIVLSILRLLSGVFASLWWSWKVSGSRGVELRPRLLWFRVKDWKKTREKQRNEEVKVSGQVPAASQVMPPSSPSFSLSLLLPLPFFSLFCSESQDGCWEGGEFGVHFDCRWRRLGRLSGDSVCCSDGGSAREKEENERGMRMTEITREGRASRGGALVTRSSNASETDLKVGITGEYSAAAAAAVADADAVLSSQQGLGFPPLCMLLLSLTCASSSHPHSFLLHSLAPPKNSGRCAATGCAWSFLFVVGVCPACLVYQRFKAFYPQIRLMQKENPATSLRVFFF